MELKITLLVLTFTVIIIMIIYDHKKCYNIDDHRGNNDQETEKYTNANISNEALNDIASVYNSNNFTATNVTSTGTLTANNLNAGTTTSTNLTGTNTTATNLTATNATLNNANATNFIGADIKLSKGWTGYPDNKTDRSEISNDTNGYKKLMIVGNKSDGTGPRKVGIWDDLTISGRTNFRVMDNVEAAGGWDMYDSGDNKSASFQECAKTCADKNALCALFSKSKKHCWCKNIIALQRNYSPDYTTVFMI